MFGIIGVRCLVNCLDDFEFVVLVNETGVVILGFDLENGVLGVVMEGTTGGVNCETVLDVENPINGFFVVVNWKRLTSGILGKGLCVVI